MFKDVTNHRKMFEKIKSYKYSGAFISVFLTAVIATVLFPAEGKFKYEYQKGRPWLYETLIAPIDFPILKNEAELRDEKDVKASQVIPYFVYDNLIKNKQIRQLSEVAAKTDLDSRITTYVLTKLSFIFDRGVVNEFSSDVKRNNLIIIQKGKENFETAAQEVFEKKAALLYLREKIQQEMPAYDAEKVLADLDVEKYLVPNVRFDLNITQIAHKSAGDYISPTKGMIYTGQIIVTKGETITAETEQLLDSFKKEYELSMGFTGSIYLLKIGQFFLIAAVLIMFAVSLYFLKKEILINSNKLNFLLMQMILIIMVTVIVRDYDQSYLYLVPYSVFALYITSFFTSKIVLPVYLIIMLPIIVIAQNGLEIYIINTLAGAMAIFTFSYFDRGWLQFVNSFFVFGGLAFAYSSFRLIEEGSFSNFSLTLYGYFFWNSLFVIAAYPFLFLFEKIFSLVSNPRLRDLSDTNSPLMQEMAEKAPGTFQHSLQVANLAESAAREIGAYALLARVGALYHDIGKMSNPMCFIENQLHGVNFHDQLTPEESAKYIIQHVEDGVAIAKKAKIPQIVIDFILSHHGKSQTYYFYNKHVNAGGDPDKRDEFTYKGILPIYKEQVIVMMADAVEAASRTLSNYSEESISELVEKMANTRLFTEQLVNADISVKDIYTIKEIFKKKLLQVHHSRITYPERKSPN